MKKIIILLYLFAATHFMIAQGVQLEGYAYETDNRGYLNEVYVTVVTMEGNEQVGSAVSNLEGYFSVEVPAGQRYIIRAKKDLFFEKTMEVDASSKVAGDKMFLKVELEREPGYLFDITLAPERANEDEVVDGIIGAKIEIYNNTKDEVALAIDSHPSMNFSYTFKKGNYYTMLVRKEGFFTKRLEAHVDIDGCILCFEGIGDIRPAVTDNLTAGHEMGTLLANIEMKKIEVDEAIPLENIYYDYRKASLRQDAVEEVEKLINILRDNPHLIVEISSHTDSRGDAPYNMQLSQRRAESVVDYLIVQGSIDPFRVRPQGYGETKLVNKCKSGVECTEEQHQKNRRTELKVVGFLGVDPLKDKSLFDIKEEERIQKLLREVQAGEVYEVPEDGNLPDEIKKDLEKNQIVESAEKDEETDFGEEVDKEQTKEDVEKSESEVEKSENVIEVETEITTEDETGMKAINDEITGFFIQVMHSSNMMEKDHPAWSTYQNVYVDQRETGGYSYLMGIYPTRESAQESLDNVLLEKFSGAFIVEMNKGKRINTNK